VEFALRAENLDGQGVEELVGEDDERNVGRERATNIRGASLCSRDG